MVWNSKREEFTSNTFIGGEKLTMKKIALLTLPLLLLGCGNCEDALSDLKAKKNEIDVSNSRIHQPLFAVIEYKIAKKQCDQSVFNEFKKTL